MKNSDLRIGIIVCTCQRPGMLKLCLDGLMQSAQEPDWHLRVCVVDNDTDASSRHIISQIQSNSQVPIDFVHEPQRGIPFARNRGLRHALGCRWDWVALIDDDEVPRQDWLQQHMAAVSSFNAQVSYGAILKKYEVDPPSWWPKDAPSTAPAGTLVRRASTANVLFSSDLIAKDKGALYFDHDLANGYEDLDFFERAVSLGYKMVWAPDAVVTETVPASRIQPDRLVAMVKSQANAHARVGVKRMGLLRAFFKFGSKGLRRIVGGSILSSLFYILRKAGFSSAEHHYFRARLRLARGLGNFTGLAARSGGYYDTIDGF